MALTGKRFHDDRITIDPEVCNGRPVIRNLRISVETVLGFLGAGDSPEEILKQYPVFEEEDIKACLAFAANLMSHKYTVMKVS